MAFDPSDDIRTALAEIGDPVTLAGGAVVYGFPSVATVEDALEGDGIYPGRTRVLRFATPDVAGVVSGHLLTWNAASHRVIKVQLAAIGHLTRLFLGAP
jgi:hypothetical protein